MEKQLGNKEFKEIIQSGHLNLLVGSGCSMNYLSTLNDIEVKMSIKDSKKEAQKDYYKLIKKSKAVLDERFENDNREKKKLTKTKQNYDNFFNFWADTISNRSLHIVNKQINIFTTNFDMFMEDSCERLNIIYNDGFVGQINPIFNVSNFNKIQKYKSLQFDNTSDVPLFNIIKLHGSVSWETKNERISYSNGSHISDDLQTKTGKKFEDGYKKIAVINPNIDKHLETVLDINYASMLRKFALELEKENSVLMIVGFSLNDKHIKALLYEVMKSNPTLIVIYFSYDKYDNKKEEFSKFKGLITPNFYIISPRNKFTFENTIKYFSEIFKEEKIQNL